MLKIIYEKNTQKLSSSPAAYILQDGDEESCHLLQLGGREGGTAEETEAAHQEAVNNMEVRP
jgi:hypothetical protein